jgi:group I intron endonuclease
LLNKIVYESYVKRPLQEMIKRVLGGKCPSGIYKITRKSTGEIYIGRAVSVDKRWVEHVKMAFSIGSIAHSTLHTIMEKDGIWNFTFELLEEVPKDQLNEREKYYIDFYDSKNFGMNQKNGG